MKTSANYNDFMGAARPPECQQPCTCRYCIRVEFGICEWDNCKSEALDAPQYWIDEYVCGVNFRGYYHNDCLEQYQEQQQDRSCA